MLSSKDLFKRRQMRSRTQLRRKAGGRPRLSVFRSSKHIYAHCFQLCQNLTNMYLSIDMVRLDNRTGNVIILAGRETLIEIYPNEN